MRLVSIVLVLAGLAGAGPASAIVGGAPDDGALSRHAVMVLAAGGRVCTGVVIAHDAVLTAAHCVVGAPGHRVHYRSSSGQPVLIEPRAIAVHPGYVADAARRRARSIDLAVVSLPAPLPAPFAPARLSEASGPPRAGTLLTVAGYGVAQPGAARTSGVFRSVALTVVEPYGPGRILVWAEAPRGTRAGACQGDSGGPMATPDGVVAAIASWSTGDGGGCGGLTQGVLVGPQAGWIAQALARAARRGAAPPRQAGAPR